jgi:DNA-binding CsgD family transcriptional regulator
MEADKAIIAIIDPSQIITAGLSVIISRAGLHYKITRYPSLEEFDRASGKKPDIIIINPSLIRHPDKEFPQLRAIYPRTIWMALVYSYFDNILLSRFDEVIGITDTENSILLKVTHAMDNPRALHGQTSREQLSTRETEVLAELVKGLSNKEIATRLNISTHTVISHRKNISQKTGIRSQAGLTIYAISNKIVSMENFNY